jgi:hypothetical protein
VAERLGTTSSQHTRGPEAGETLRELHWAIREMGEFTPGPSPDVWEGNSMAGSTKRTPGRKEKAARLGLSAIAAGGAQESAGVEKPAERSHIEAFLDEDSGNLKTFIEANEAIMNGMATLSAEMMAFGTKRLRANIERSETLTGCGDVEQAFRVQSEFFESATQQYLGQANQVMNLMAAMTKAFWGPLEEQTKEALRDLTEQTGSSKQS